MPRKIRCYPPSPPPPPPQIGEFRTRRKALGYSQNQLARCLGVTVATVQAWEHGRRAIRPSIWRHLALVEERAERYRDRPAL